MPSLMKRHQNNCNQIICCIYSSIIFSVTVFWPKMPFRKYVPLGKEDMLIDVFSFKLPWLKTILPSEEIN